MIKRQISLKTLSQNIFLADSFESLISDRFVEGALYVRCKKQLLMLKKENSKKRERKFTLEDLALVGMFRMNMTEILIGELGEEVKCCLENDTLACMGLFMAGIYFGDDNPNLIQREILLLKEGFRSLAKDIMELLGDKTLKNFEANEEIYTQILIKGILYGQKKPLMNSNDNMQ